MIQPSETQILEPTNTQNLDDNFQFPDEPMIPDFLKFSFSKYPNPFRNAEVVPVIAEEPEAIEILVAENEKTTPNFSFAAQPLPVSNFQALNQTPDYLEQLKAETDNLYPQFEPPVQPIVETFTFTNYPVAEKPLDFSIAEKPVVFESNQEYPQVENTVIENLVKEEAVKPVVQSIETKPELPIAQNSRPMLSGYKPKAQIEEPSVPQKFNRELMDVALTEMMNSSNPAPKPLEEYIKTSPTLSQLNLKFFFAELNENSVAITEREKNLRTKSLLLLVRSDDILHSFFDPEQEFGKAKQTEYNSLTAQMKEVNGILKIVSGNLEGDDVEERKNQLLYIADQLTESIARLDTTIVKHGEEYSDVLKLKEERAKIREAEDARRAIEKKIKDDAKSRSQRLQRKPRTNKLLIAATVLVWLAGGGTFAYNYYFPTTAVPLPNQNVKTINPKQLRGGETLKTVRISNQLLLGIAGEEWTQLPEAKRKENLTNLLESTAAQGVKKIMLVNEQNEPIASASSDGINTSGN